MGFIADLHVHSRHSRATSREMTPEGLWFWAQVKGISVIGTGDFTHPEYFGELSEKLEPAGDADGLFTLRRSFRPGGVPASCARDVYFMLQAEVSSIYRKNGRTRKVHSILLAPGFREAGKLNERLSRIGNLKSDGRPILGLDAKVLLETALDVSSDNMVVPAHAWTPHFSVFGAASGFDSLDECYEELAPHITAIETGLSSDPPMNRRLSALDRITLISNSDAHSPAKLGREANVFECDVSYRQMRRAMRGGGGFGRTIEFFPEEGKYHLDGHRGCGVCLRPEESIRRGNACPVCGRALTIGVLHRVEELADRKKPVGSDFVSIVPLAELIAGVLGKGPSTKGVRRTYMQVIDALGSEFHVLLESPINDIEAVAGEGLSGAVRKMRSGEIELVPGYDGVYGKVIVPGGEAKPPPKRPAGRRGKGRERLF